MKHQAKKTSIQLIKYSIVGASNTLLTLIVIFICNDLIGLKLLVANPIGYVVGLINSFIWNKQWVFKSHNHTIKREIMLFVVGFLICFGIQWVTVWSLIKFTPITDFSFLGIPPFIFGEYAATIIGMGVYTICNYAYNRFVTFKPKVSA